MTDIPPQLSLPVQFQRFQGSSAGQPIAIGSEDNTDPTPIHTIVEYTENNWPFIDRVYLWLINKSSESRMIHIVWRGSGSPDATDNFVWHVIVEPYETKLVADGWPAQFLTGQTPNSWDGIAAYTDDAAENDDVLAHGYVLRNFQLGAN